MISSTVHWIAVVTKMCPVRSDFQAFIRTEIKNIVRERHGRIKTRKEKEMSTSTDISADFKNASNKWNASVQVSGRICLWENDSTVVCNTLACNGKKIWQYRNLAVQTFYIVQAQINKGLINFVKSDSQEQIVKILDSLQKDEIHLPSRWPWVDMSV